MSERPKGRELEISLDNVVVRVDGKEYVVCLSGVCIVEDEKGQEIASEQASGRGCP